MVFEQSFIKTNQSYFDAEVAGLNFDDPNSVDIINGWVAGRTHDKIEKIISQISPDHVMFLINAIYFNGTWVYEFDKEHTHDSYFTGSAGAQLPCKMMLVTGKFQYTENEQFQAIALWRRHLQHDRHPAGPAGQCGRTHRAAQ
jgi:serpin B